jgi:lactoylglutathione lyase
VTAETKTATNVEPAVPFFRVSDMAASLRYYVDGVGFQMKHKWIDDGKLRWCWLELGRAALMLQEFRKDGHDSWVPESRVGVGVSVCFQCKDALALYREFRSRGIQTEEPFVGNRLWVVPLSDPDGYRIDFENPTDITEDTKLSECKG